MPDAIRFSIHKIRIGDIPDLFSIAEECNLSRWSAQDYSDEAERPDSTMILLKTDFGETAGFLVGRRVISSTTNHEYDAEIYNIGVKKAFQKNGFGTELLRAFLERSRNESVKNIWLDVRISNTSAIRFYKNFGFTEYTRRPGFYSDPTEDGIVMKLSL